jgi:hypothetical protein
MVRLLFVSSIVAAAVRGGIGEGTDSTCVKTLLCAIRVAARLVAEVMCRCRK